MVNLKTFSTAELLDDRNSALDDIALCRAAKSIGDDWQQDGWTLDTRMKGCQLMVKAIEAELARRGVLPSNAPTTA
jgi:hypothetical protein